MQGNVKHGYPASEYLASSFPPLSFLCATLAYLRARMFFRTRRLEIAAINYTAFLRRIHTIEVPEHHEVRVVGCLKDFALRGVESLIRSPRIAVSSS